MRHSGPQATANNRSGHEDLVHRQDDLGQDSCNTRNGVQRGQLEQYCVENTDQTLFFQSLSTQWLWLHMQMMLQGVT